MEAASIASPALFGEQTQNQTNKQTIILFQPHRHFADFFAHFEIVFRLYT
jgi:hypothetical protein